MRITSWVKDGKGITFLVVDKSAMRTKTANMLRDEGEAFDFLHKSTIHVPEVTIT